MDAYVIGTTVIPGHVPGVGDPADLLIDTPWHTVFITAAARNAGTLAQNQKTEQLALLEQAVERRRPVHGTRRAAWSNRVTPLQSANLLNGCLGLMMDRVQQVWHTPRILSQCTPKRRNGQPHSEEDLLNLIEVCTEIVRRKPRESMAVAAP